MIAQGKGPRIPQDDALSSYAPMLDKEAAKIDFTKPARQVHNLIRGMSSWPTAHTLMDGRLLKIHRARVAAGKGEAGVVLDEKNWIVGCGEGAVQLLEIQTEGSRRMPAADYLRGHPIQKGLKLGI